MKDLSHASDPQMKEAGKSRKKSLKVLLKALQQPDVSQQDREQLLLKAVVNQVCIWGHFCFNMSQDPMTLEHSEIEPHVLHTF